MPIKIMIVVGARPNFMKAAPIVTAIKQHNQGLKTDEPIRHVLVHTGQHYSASMSDTFFEDLKLSPPDVDLGVGSGSHAEQTAEIMKRFEPVLLRESPDALVVVGDVNSTIACTLVAAKVSLDSKGTRPLIAHVEAGLRSFDRSMPEEINRVLTDHISDLLFATEENALENLANEGIPRKKVHFVGNTMIDSLLACRDRAESSTILERLGLLQGAKDDHSNRSTRRYALLTLHRPANVDDRDVFLNIVDGLDGVIKDHVVIFPVHPRTQKRIAEFGLNDRFDTGADHRPGAIRLTEPLGYLDFMCLMANAALVITDSGGIQEETTCLGVPCVTVRENTERPSTLNTGTNVLAGVATNGIRSAISRQLESPVKGGVPELWDGKAAVRIVDILRRQCLEKRGIESGAEVVRA